jgi:hypothetical protein
MPSLKAMNKENMEVLEAKDGKKPNFPCPWNHWVGILNNPQSKTDFYQLHTAAPWERIEQGSKYHKFSAIFVYRALKKICVVNATLNALCLRRTETESGADSIIIYTRLAFSNGVCLK